MWSCDGTSGHLPGHAAGAMCGPRGPRPGRRSFGLVALIARGAVSSRLLTLHWPSVNGEPFSPFLSFLLVPVYAVPDFYSKGLWPHTHNAIRPAFSFFFFAVRTFFCDRVRLWVHCSPSRARLHPRAARPTLNLYVPETDSAPLLDHPPATGQGTRGMAASSPAMNSVHRNFFSTRAVKPRDDRAPDGVRTHFFFKKKTKQNKNQTVRRVARRDHDRDGGPCGRTKREGARDETKPVVSCAAARGRGRQAASGPGRKGEPGTGTTGPRSNKRCTTVPLDWTGLDWTGPRVSGADADPTRWTGRRAPPTQHSSQWPWPAVSVCVCACRIQAKRAVATRTPSHSRLRMFSPPVGDWDDMRRLL